MTTTIESRDLDSSMADALERVRRGEVVTIADRGFPIARIVPVEAKPRRPELGALKGMVDVAADFNAPLPEDELQEWEK